MKKLLLSTIAVSFLLVFSMSGVMAWGWTPNWDFLPDFDFQFPDFCNVDADCGTSTSCTALSCQVSPSSGVKACAVSYAPNGTYCNIPYNECDGAGNCVYVAPPVLDCNDNNVCTEDYDTIISCSHVPIDCNDNNALTTDTCVPATGCVHTLPQGSCDDGNACTIDTDMSFIGGGCLNTPITCNDQDESTTDTCVPATGCVFTPQTPLVPEFGTVVLMLTALGALGIFFTVRRSK